MVENDNRVIKWYYSIFSLRRKSEIIVFIVININKNIIHPRTQDNQVLQYLGLARAKTKQKWKSLGDWTKVKQQNKELYIIMLWLLLTSTCS